MKQLLVETFPIRLEKSVILESQSRNNGRIIIPKMIIQRADVPNKNKRIYRRNILEREVNRCFADVKAAGSRGLLGELDHIDNSIINLKNVALGMLDYSWRGNDLLGDVEILHTSHGNILKEILLAGYVPGISSRGMGSVESLHESDDPDLVEVQDDFQLVCWDAVSDPSTHNAYFKSVDPSYPNTVTESFHPKVDKYVKINSIIQDICCELGNVCCIKN